MLIRKVDMILENFLKTSHSKALLITGARQVGKTFSVREFGKKNYSNFVEINFIENPEAIKLFENAKNSADILLRISVLKGLSLVPNETLIFFDEVQECKEIVTAIKFLVEEGSYRYILSGSLLGVELKDIRSMPVGYMDIVQMFPMDFQEFSIANGVSEEILGLLKESFEKRIPIDQFIHRKMQELFKLYLIVGGMPASVNTFLQTNNIKEVVSEQKAIIEMYKKDISKYDPKNKLHIEDIFNLIPSELNAQNKRFIMKNIHDNFKLSRYDNSFIWLSEAGVALPTYNVSEPTLPLLLSKSSNLFKLFLSDVGLLSSMYAENIQIKILNEEVSINYGGIFENIVAQELKAHGFYLYYFNSKKQGEIDFIIEHQGNVLPIEVKSGKSYSRHNALNNLLSCENYDIPEAMVFSNENVHQSDKVIYYPIYLVMFLEKEGISEDVIYKPDFSMLS